MNKELVSVLLRLLGKVSAVMILIVIACLVTPKIAKWIEKKQTSQSDPSAEGEDVDVKAENYDVKGPFDADKQDDWDPNYKIYNTDIYGVDFKNGKKRKKNG